MNKHSIFFSLILFSQAATAALAEPLHQSQTVSGGIGLVEMPSARMAKDGAFSVHLSKATPYNRYVVTGQPLEWLEVLFKYTGINNRNYGANNQQSYKDKSVDVKARLFEEGYYLPEISVGIKDVGGTGLFSGEYLVASKQIDRLDLSIGAGWGYFASGGDFSNPFTKLSDRFSSRESDTGQGGTVDPTKFFSGDKVSVFAGASYHFENYPLVLKAELDANDYQNEPLSNVFEQDSPLNASVVYSPMEGLDLHLGWVRGNTTMLGLTLRTNVKQSKVVKFLDPKPEPVNVKLPSSNQITDWSEFRDKLCKNSGFCAEQIQISDQQVSLKGSQKTFIAKSKGIGRAARMLSNRLDQSVSRINFEES
ncbi:MAG: YjbH domain-containing protein, partial [Hydrogenovibrio sp.]|uniref:YjbH domain-containing protein n=1 Tax=Hydrogenovibrio sp. TaxID=2065821 RepID=UPI0028709C90